ncbi:hypothetical protein IVB30_08240 [Bradyrhizobium sp. 200]|uniref:hypothetical protein n=1 Tax=Bradyrhizobium sp. 200 TaxID=2782665 RepID=UPI001FFE771A|nr:hypothetical protein [Bradyrhizobium sp. 200]UPJ51322.1 hypothetical protein IVB30_08240 [Bradyrhizobium sp. 200]
MGRTKRKSIKPSRTEQLQERAVFFRRLADGAGNLKFATKLQVLVDEYEREARRAASQIEAPGAPQEFEGASGTYPAHHTDH